MCGGGDSEGVFEGVTLDCSWGLPESTRFHANLWQLY